MKKSYLNQIFENEHNSNFYKDDRSDNRKNKESSSLTDNDREKEIEDKSNITSYINSIDKRENKGSESSFGLENFSLKNEIELKEKKEEFPEIIQERENHLLINQVKVNFSFKL